MEAVTPGTVFVNPGGGTSEVISVRDGKVRYRRKNSTMSISVENLFAAYATFRGRTMYSSELKVISPEIYDSAARPAGHSCNATFLFLALVAMGLASRIYGNGKRGDPFYIEVPA